MLKFSVGKTERFMLLWVFSLFYIFCREAFLKKKLSFKKTYQKSSAFRVRLIHALINLFALLTLFIIWYTVLYYALLQFGKAFYKHYPLLNCFYCQNRMISYVYKQCISFVIRFSKANCATLITLGHPAARMAAMTKIYYSKFSEKWLCVNVLMSNCPNRQTSIIY